MLISEFDYELPEELIAQEPLEDRSASRMLVVDRERNEFSDHEFREFPSFLRPGDLLVVNNTRVFPARLLGRSETGANVELFLVEEREAARLGDTCPACTTTEDRKKSTSSATNYRARGDRENG